MAHFLVMVSMKLISNSFTMISYMSYFRITCLNCKLIFPSTMRKKINSFIFIGNPHHAGKMSEYNLAEIGSLLYHVGPRIQLQLSSVATSTFTHCSYSSIPVNEFFTIRYPVAPASFVEKNSLALLNYLCTSLENELTKHVVYFQPLYSAPLIYLPLVFLPTPRFLGYYSFKGSGHC